MTVTYGFYNSVANDRKYSAVELSKMFDGVINDGVFPSVGDALEVIAAGGMTINVGTGRAWFNHTWTYNDAILPIVISTAEAVLNRIDIIVLEVNSDNSVRTNSIKLLKGAPATNPVPPTLTNTTYVHQYPIAHIYIGAGVTQISQTNITNKIGTVDCPFAEAVGLEALLPHWEGEFDVWFADLKTKLSGDVAANLQNQIDGVSTTVDGHTTTINGHTTTINGHTTTINGLSTTTSGLVTNVDNLVQNLLKVMMRTTGLIFGDNAWSDSINDASGLNAAASSNYWMQGGDYFEYLGASSIDACVGGTVISSGDYVAAAGAFDDSTSTYWSSVQQGGAVAGAAYIGYVTPSPKNIAIIHLRQNQAANTNSTINNVHVQYWDGATWITALTTSIGPDLNIINVPNVGTSTQWRVLANGNPLGGSTYRWIVYEVSMFERASQAVLQWPAQTSSAALVKTVVQAILSGTWTFQISRNGGNNWTTITPDTIADISTQPPGTSIVLKATSNVVGSKLYAIAWGGEV